MKLKNIFAVSALAFTGQAFSLPPTTVPTLDVFQSGASAQQASLGATFTQLCQAGTKDVYYDAATGGKNYRAYFCTIANQTGANAGLNGQKVLFNSRAAGGSSFGVTPVARAEAIERMVVNGTCTATTTVPSATYTCPNTLLDVPDFGVSDVEPALFSAAVNVPTGTIPPAAAELARLTVASEHAVQFVWPPATPCIWRYSRPKARPLVT